jgi:hypothetical protein
MVIHYNVGNHSNQFNKIIRLTKLNPLFNEWDFLL